MGYGGRPWRPTFCAGGPSDRSPIVYNAVYDLSHQALTIGFRVKRAPGLDPDVVPRQPRSFCVLRRLLLLALLIPLVELAILVWIASKTSVLFTIGLVLFMGVAGMLLARFEGLRVWRQVQMQLQRGETPTDSLLDAVLILVAGLLLALPGVLTDVLGLLLLVPPIRRIVRYRLQERFRTQIHTTSSRGRYAGAGEPAGDRIIDVKVIDVEPEQLEAERPEDRRV